MTAIGPTPWQATWAHARTIESATSERECEALYLAAVQADAIADVLYRRDETLLAAVEIGTWCGRTALVIEAALNRMALTTIDRFERFVDVCGNKTIPPTREQVLHHLAERRASRVRVVQGTSTAIAGSWSDRVGFLFIDGDHADGGPQADWAAWEPHLHMDAIVCWHDYIPEEPDGPYRAVARTVDLLLAMRELYVITRVGTLLVTGILV